MQNAGAAAFSREKNMGSGASITYAQEFVHIHKLNKNVRGREHKQLTISQICLIVNSTKKNQSTSRILARKAPKTCQLRCDDLFQVCVT